MSHGLKIWSPSGNLILDTSTRVGRLLGSIETGTNDGSFTPPSVVGGQLFAFVSTGLPGSPGIAVSNGVIYWAFTYYYFTQITIPKQSVRITYGVM
jgi:hypothetical protein